MRGTRVMFLVVGWPLLIGGLIMAGFAVVNRDDFDVLLGLGISGLSLAGTGVVFLFVARYLKNFLGAAALDDPVQATALVQSVTDTGTTINNVNAVFEIRATITAADRAPYDGEFRIVVGRAQFGLIQPGMTVPVLVERSDPTRIVHDPDRPVVAGGLGTRAVATVPTTASASRTMSAADVIARGVATQGKLHAADPVGLTAGQVVPTLAPHEADDPLVKVIFTCTPNGMGEQRSEVLVRVPDDKGHWLRPGETLPIAYLSDDPTTATIDWSRL